MPRAGVGRTRTRRGAGRGVLRRGLEEKPAATDEAEAVESTGYNTPRLVQGESTNVKVTFAEDLQVAEMILERRGRITL